MEAYGERENDRRASRQHHGAVRDGLGVNGKKSKNQRKSLIDLPKVPIFFGPEENFLVLGDFFLFTTKSGVK